jgi:hypothetical protein
MVEERVCDALMAQLDQGGRLSCAAAFQVGQDLGVEPLTVGRAADALGVRLSRCQLGLFGYGPKARGEHKVVVAAPQVDARLADALRRRSEGERLSCAAAWEIASAFEMPKMRVAAAAEALGVKIVHCQLGAF